MKTRSTFISLLVCTVALGSVRAGDRAARSWAPKDGMLKNLIVESFDDNRRVTSYTFHLLIVGSEKIDGRDCWKLAFVPGDQTPAQSKRRIEVHVDKERGWPRKVIAVKASSTAVITKIDQASFIADAEVDIPIDMLPLGASQEFKEANAKVKCQSIKIGNEFVADLAYLVDGKEKLRVRQRWTEGEDWWRYYEKHVDGKLVLRARLNTAPQLDEAFAKLDAPIAPSLPKSEEKHPLRQDKRLHAFVKIEPNRPSVSHMLGRIKAATGVELEIAPELADHVPDLGYISPSPNGYYAWQLMEHLAKVELENGQWEKNGTGYRLGGLSKAPPGRELVTSGDKVPVPSGRLSPWLVASGVGLALAFGGLVAVVGYRKWSSSASGMSTKRPAKNVSAK